MELRWNGCLRKIKTEARLHWRGFAAMGLVFAMVIFANEVMLRGSLYKASRWIITNPPLFLLNWGLMMALAGLLLLVIPALYPVTLMVAMPVLWLGAVNGVKMAIRTAPLTLGDMLLVKELILLMPLLRELRYINDMIIGTILVVIIALLLKDWISAGLLKQHYRFTGSLLAATLLLLTLTQPFNRADRDMWDKGFLYTLLVPPAEEKSFEEEVLLAAENKVEALLTSQEIVEETAVNPNIIVIMSESFWDINRLGVSFTKNPIPNFQALKKESLYGDLYVPVFSGGTGNTEFEMLTGMSLLNFKNNWHMVYNHEIKGPIPSLASIFRQQGYLSVGIHPYTDWFYNRLDVYRHMGFERFESIDDVPDVQAHLVGEYVSDAYLTQRIINLLEEEKRPVFAAVVTMQNHGPYNNERYSEESFQVKVRDELSRESTLLVNTYAQGLYLSDQALGELVEYLRENEEPTLLLFFGDHLPMLGENHLVFRETGYIENETNQALMNDLRMTTVPYIIWSNYGTPVGEQPLMNTSFIAPQLLALAGKEMPHYLKLVDAIREKTPLIMRSRGYDAEGNPLTVEDPAYQLSRAEYQLADQLYRQRIPGADTYKWVVDNNSPYQQENPALIIQEVFQTDKGTYIIGERFDPRLQLLVDEKPAGFFCQDQHTIVTDESLPEGSVVVLRRLGVDGEVLMASETYEIPGEE